MSTFASIQSEVAERYNLTSSQALARIGRSINEYYKKVGSAIGIQTIERQNGISATTTIGNRELVFNAEKLLVVYNPAFTPPIVLDERSEDEMRNEIPITDPPTEYAVKLMGSSTVTIELNSVPASQYVLKADAMVNLATLSGNQIPAFAEDFHDILTLGASYVELKKMEKWEAAKDMKAQYEERLSALRLYIAVSAYKLIQQAKTNPAQVYPPLI